MLNGETHKYEGKILNEIDVVGDFGVSSDEKNEDGNLTAKRKDFKLENTRNVDKDSVKNKRDVDENEVNEHLIEKIKKKKKK